MEHRSGRPTDQKVAGSNPAERADEVQVRGVFRRSPLAVGADDGSRIAEGGSSVMELVCVLGDVRAVGPDGGIVEIPGSSQRRLLGLLALHTTQRLRTERLADVLGMSPGSLRRSVSRLRAVLGPESLVTTSTGYVLSCPVDAVLFCEEVAGAAGAPDRVAALERAVGRWAGSALEEFAAEDWARAEVARLTEIRGAAVDDLADELLSARRPEDAIAHLERQIARHPYRDRSQGLLIRALALAGRQADALRVFQAYHSTLADELGTEPSPEVVRIERRVASGWDGASSATVTDGTRRAGAFPLPAPLARSDRFVGRSAEQRVLLDELASVTTTGLRCVLVTGESGMGKTMLLADLAMSAADMDVTVLYGASDETGVSLEPFRTILGVGVEHADDDLLGEHVARCGGELVRLCPRLATRVPTAPPPTQSDDATERFLTFEAVADLFSRIAGRGRLVLMLDDLQWTEPTALLLLRHLTRALSSAPVLVVLARREPGEPASEELRSALAELERARARHLSLPPFGDDEIAALVADLLPSTPDSDRDGITAAVRVETAGNPLYATEVLRHWRERGWPDDTHAVPPSLREVLWGRTQALGGEAAEVMATASVLGSEFPEDLLTEMVDLPEARVRTAIDSALSAGVLIDVTSVRRTLRFAHVLIANALYAEVGASTRAHLHERAVGVLATRTDSSGPDLAVQLARHSALAGMGPEAIHWSTVAGDDALDHLSPIEAARHFRHALDVAVELGRPLAEQADLLARLGEAQHVAGDSSALGTLVQAANLARDSGNSRALSRAALASDRGFMRIDAGAPEYLAIVESAVGTADPTDTSTYGQLLALLAQSLVYTPQADRRIATAHQALALADSVSDPVLLARVAPAAVAALWMPGNAPVRRAVTVRALASAEASGDPRLEFAVRMVAYNVAVESGDAAVAAHNLARIRAIAWSVGEPRLRWITGLYDTFDATMAGRLEEAETLASANLELGTEIGAPDAFTLFAGQFFVIGTFAGRHADLLPLVEQAANEHPGVAPFELAHAIVCAVVGPLATARKVLHDAMANRLADLPVDNIWMTRVIGYAVLAIDLQDTEAAALLLPAIEPFGAEVAFSGLTSQGPVSAYVGKLNSVLGRHEEAEDHLLQALGTATAFGWTYHRATTLLALSQARHRGRGALDPEARSWLAEAAELCRNFGFDRWLPQIDELEAAVAPS
jgi:DNA-binding SARP family transcriptional activator